MVEINSATKDNRHASALLSWELLPRRVIYTDAGGDVVLFAFGADSWRCCRYTANDTVLAMVVGFHHVLVWVKNGAWGKLRDEPHLARKLASLRFCQICLHLRFAP